MPAHAVVEGPGPDDVKAVALEVLVAHQVLGDLAHGVGGERPERVGLPDRQLVLVDHAIFLAAAHGEEARLEPEPADRFEEIDLRDDVGGQRLGRLVPRGADEALGGQMDHVGGVGEFHERPHRGQVAQVGLDEGDARPQVVDVLALAPPPAGAEDLRALGERVFGHVAPDEPRDARDQYPHGTLVYKVHPGIRPGQGDEGEPPT